MSKLLRQLSKIEEAINNAQPGWTLCVIGEDQSKKLAALTNDLRRKMSRVGDGKQIASGFSYWGIGPSIAWSLACNDPFYLVMKESIETFQNRWSQTLPSLDRQDYHYVSLGVGTGHKDRYVLNDLYKINPEIFYFPVDMSPEMLRVGVQESIKGTPLERCKVLPIQLDFSIDNNIINFRSLLNRVSGDEPVLFSLLGNTLANFERDTTLLKTISKLIRPQDRLLLEVAYTDDLSEEAAQEAAQEYSESRAFREFVTSALLQNTDLRVDIDDVSFIGVEEQDRAIRIKALYYNKAGSTVKITLPDRSKVDFPVEDTIRLLLTRKYTSKGIQDLISASGLSLLSEERSEFPPSENRFNFGMELLLLTPTVSNSMPSWQSVFISYGAPDQEFAMKLNKSLNDRGVRTFFFLIDNVPGERAHNIMRKGVNEFDRTILVCSQQSLERMGVLNELDLVLSRESREGGSNRLLPITLDRYVFDSWLPVDGYLKTAILDRSVCDFISADVNNSKFETALETILSALKLPKGE